MPKSNFNFLRLAFALLVVITHSYPLSGATGSDYLAEITNGQVSFSFIGLSGFFIISGYLVFQSLDRSPSLVSYFKNRALRIFPALFVVLLLTILLGFLVYDYDFHHYISNRSVWTYLPRNLFLVKGQGIIDGVFTHSIYNPTINGSLWSLLYEVSFYILLSALFVFNRRVQIFLVFLGLILLLTGRLFWYQELSKYNFIWEARLVLEYAPFFFFGSLLALLKIENVKSRNQILIVCTILLISFTALGFFGQVKFFLLPIIVILSGLGSIPFVNRVIEWLGDISYGIYIYAFPIQQACMHYWSLNALELMALSVILASAFGYASWHVIEKRALRFKD